MSERRHPPSIELEAEPCSGRQHALLEDVLLEFLTASPTDRDRMVHDARVALATAGLHRAVLREALDGRLAEHLDRFPALRGELETVERRIEESARALLGMRAAAATIALTM